MPVKMGASLEPEIHPARPTVFSRALRVFTDPPPLRLCLRRPRSLLGPFLWAYWLLSTAEALKGLFRQRFSVLNLFRGSLEGRLKPRASSRNYYPRGEYPEDSQE